MLAELHRTLNCCCFSLGLSWFQIGVVFGPTPFCILAEPHRTVNCCCFRLGLSWFEIGVVLGPTHLSECWPNLTEPWTVAVSDLGVVVGPTPCCILAEPHRTFTLAVPSSRVPRSPQLPQYSPFIASRDQSLLTVTRLTEAATLHLAICHPLQASLRFTFHG